MRHKYTFNYYKLNCWRSSFITDALVNMFNTVCVGGGGGDFD